MKNLCVNLKKQVDLSYPIIIKQGILNNIEEYLEDRKYLINRGA